MKKNKKSKHQIIVYTFIFDAAPAISVLIEILSPLT